MGDVIIRGVERCRRYHHTAQIYKQHAFLQIYIMLAVRRPPCGAGGLVAEVPACLRVDGVGCFALIQVTTWDRSLRAAWKSRGTTLSWSRCASWHRSRSTAPSGAQRHLLDRCGPCTRPPTAWPGKPIMRRSLQLCFEVRWGMPRMTEAVQGSVSDDRDATMSACIG